MKFSIPIRLPSLPNTRWDWRKLMGFKSKQKKTVQRYMIAALREQEIPDLPLRVTLTRVGKRKLDDDNLAAAFKYVRDQVAELIGPDDGDVYAYQWKYRQRVEGRYSIEVEIQTQ